MKKSAYIALLIYIVISFIGVTFAWFSQPENPKGKAAILEYSSEEGKNTLTASGRDIDVHVEAYDSETDTYYSIDSLNTLLEVNKLVPNNKILFKLVFTNTGLTDTHVSLQLANMETDYELFFDNMYFGIYDTTGYPSLYSNNPIGTYVCLKDELIFNESYRTTLVNQLYIYPTKKDQTIELYSYFQLNRLVDNNFQGKTFKLGSFRVII